MQQTNFGEAKHATPGMRPQKRGAAFSLEGETWIPLK
jgi:hypothetical protein